jgi:hypothetical protein
MVLIVDEGQVTEFKVTETQVTEFERQVTEKNSVTCPSYRITKSDCKMRITENADYGTECGMILVT